MVDVDLAALPEDARLSLVFHFQQRGARYRFNMEKNTSQRSYAVPDKPFLMRSSHSSDCVSVVLFAQREGRTTAEEVGATTEGLTLGGGSKDVGVRWLSLVQKTDGPGAKPEVCRLQVMWEVSSVDLGLQAQSAAIPDAAAAAREGNQAAVPLSPAITRGSVSGVLAIIKTSAKEPAASEPAPALPRVPPESRSIAAALPDPCATPSQQLKGSLLVAAVVGDEPGARENPVTHLGPPPLHKDPVEGSGSAPVPSPGQSCDKDPVSLSAKPSSPHAAGGQGGEGGEEAEGTERAADGVVFVAKGSDAAEQARGLSGAEPKSAMDDDDDDGEGSAKEFDAMEESYRVPSSTSGATAPSCHSGDAGGLRRLDLFTASTQRGVPIGLAYRNLYLVPAPDLMLRRDDATGNPLRQRNTGGMLRQRLTSASEDTTPASLHWMHASALDSIRKQWNSEKTSDAVAKEVTDASALSPSRPSANASTNANNRSSLQYLKEDALRRAERQPVLCTWRR